MIERKIHVLPEKVPAISLRYGQTIWLLTELGLRGPVSKDTFHEYLKGLRRLGIPFGREKFQTSRRRRLAKYSYSDLMELALTLSLRVYHVVPDSVIKGIARRRDLLRRLFRRAYNRRDISSGVPTVIGLKGYEPLVLRGLFLDLNVKFAGGQLVRFGPPKLLRSIEAVTRFSQNLVSARPLVPINLSFLAEQVVVLALNAPTSRRKRPRAAAKPVSGRRQQRKFKGERRRNLGKRRGRHSPVELRGRGE